MTREYEFKISHYAFSVITVAMIYSGVFLKIDSLAAAIAVVLWMVSPVVILGALFVLMSDRASLTTPDRIETTRRMAVDTTLSVAIRWVTVAVIAFGLALSGRPILTAVYLLGCVLMGAARLKSRRIVADAHG